jgi:hypothetical protein
VHTSAYAAAVDGAVVGDRADVIASVTVAQSENAWQGKKGVSVRRLCQLCAVQALLDDVPETATWSPRRSRSRARPATVQYAESSSDARAALAGQPEATLLTAPPTPSASRRRCACQLVRDGDARTDVG